jgi:hypothetical protein
MFALAACSPKTPGANATGPAAGASQSAATDPNAAANAPNYPDWARAVVAPYPNASVALAVNTGLYQFQSSDDPATVLAWYKGHVAATWTQDATVASNWNGVANGVQVSIAAPEVKANGVNTMIEISKR